MELTREYLHEQIADAIQRMIAENQLQAGDQLPSERDLSVMLGVSRATLRDAICVLQERGLVEMRLGSGTYITPVSGMVVADSIRRYLVFGTSSYEELLMLRERLEPEIAALAAERATPEDLERIGQLAWEIEDRFASEDGEGYVQVDSSFHEALAEATHNELVAAVVGGLHGVMQAWVRAQFRTGRAEEGAFSHRPVWEAVVARDPNRAREAAQHHLAILRSILASVLEEPAGSHGDVAGRPRNETDH